MTGKTRALCIAFAVWLSTTSAALAQPAGSFVADPTGEWLVAKGIARIKIANCDGRLWGVVAWEAQPGTDSKNPDFNLRSRPTLGMPIMLGMAPSKPNQWDGQIYNSQDGRTYSASISLLDPNSLRVKGCFLGFLCGGENWTRVDPTNTPGGGGTQKQSAPPKPPSRTTANGQPNASGDICSRISGPTGLPHEGGLK